MARKKRKPAAGVVRNLARKGVSRTKAREIGRKFAAQRARVKKRKKR